MNQVDEILKKIDRLNYEVVSAFLHGHRVSSELTTRAVSKGADYVEKNMPSALIFTTNEKRDMWDYAVNKIKVDGHIAEFGVFEGNSINYLWMS
jgi:hypothetical protein